MSRIGAAELQRVKTFKAEDRKEAALAYRQRRFGALLQQGVILELLALTLIPEGPKESRFAGEANFLVLYYEPLTSL